MIIMASKPVPQSKSSVAKRPDGPQGGIVVAVILLVLGLVVPSRAQWTNVGDGIEYRKFTLLDPNNVFVTRLARSNTNAIIGSMIASNRVAGARETVSAMAARYEDALNGWGGDAGQRNNVVVAINGSFFTLATGVITGGHIQDGWYAKRFDDWSGQTGFVWKNDRSCLIGGCPHIVNGEQTVTLGGVSRNYQGLNVARGADQLIVYTPHYHPNTLTDASGVEVLVELPAPLAIADYPAGVTGTIKEVRSGQGATPIPFGHVVLSGAGTAATFLQNNAVVGQTAKITADVTHYNSACNTAFGVNLDNAYSLVQGNFVFLRGGVVQTTTNSGMVIRNPRTFVAYNASHVFFVVCDGRTAQSVGMTSDEMGAFCLNSLGATDAVNLDGGGSSAMWINGAIVNHPSDGTERTVANGLMMVNLLPKVVSTAFTPGQAVTTTATASLRLGPGTDHFAFATLPGGASGVVLSHRLNGVLAKGEHWWLCSLGGASGWIAGGSLAAAGGGTNCPAPTLINGSFEGGQSGGVATGWVGYQRPPNPTTVWSLQTASPPAGAGAQYQQIANTSSTGGGGVRQDVTGCIIGATYTVSGWMRGNSANAVCTVKVSPSASTSWATAVDLNPPQTYAGNTWVPFSGTVKATGPSMTLWLDGQTTGTGLNKAQCFDAVTVTCSQMPVPLRFLSAEWQSPNQVRLTITGEPGVNITLQRSGNLGDWVNLTNQPNPTGTVQFVDAAAGGFPQLFYRARWP
jgi:hypothetical protein